jgi:hypothetical protein
MRQIGCFLLIIQVSFMRLKNILISSNGKKSQAYLAIARIDYLERVVYTSRVHITSLNQAGSKVQSAFPPLYKGAIDFAEHQYPANVSEAVANAAFVRSDTGIPARNPRNLQSRFCQTR